MPRDRIRRYDWKRSARPRKWGPYLFTRAASASHTPPKTGGYRAIRHMIAEVRAKEASDPTLTVNVINEVITHD